MNHAIPIFLFTFLIGTALGQSKPNNVPQAKNPLNKIVQSSVDNSKQQVPESFNNQPPQVQNAIGQNYVAYRPGQYVVTYPYGQYGYPVYGQYGQYYWQYNQYGQYVPYRPYRPFGSYGHYLTYPQYRPVYTQYASTGQAQNGQSAGKPSGSPK